MDLLNLWLPLLGGGLLAAIAIGGWFADQKLVAIWFGFFAAVSLLLLAALQLQEHEISRRTEAAKDDYPNRPWVGVQEIDMRPLNPGDLSIRVRFRNAGGSPALRLRAMVQWNIFGKDQAPPAIGEIGADAKEVIVFPNDTVNIPIFQKDGFTPYVAGLRDGSSILWVSGRFEYRDERGGIHHTIFQDAYDPQTQGFTAFKTEAN